MKSPKLRGSIQLALLLLLMTLGGPQTNASPGLKILQQTSTTSNYLTAFRLSTSNLSLIPTIVYPTSTVVWVFARSLSPPYYSQILAFKPEPLPHFTVNVSLTGVLPSSSITVDPQGRVWYGAGKMLAYYDPATGTNKTVTSFPGGNLDYLTIDNKSRVWFTLTAANSIGLFDPAKPGNNTFQVPTARSSLIGIASAPDGSVWFAEASARKLGRLDPDTSIIMEYTAPQDVASPYQLAVDSRGIVWFTDHASSDFGSFNPLTGEWRKIPVGYCLRDCVLALPNAIFVANGRVWFSEHLRGVIGGYDPISNLLVEYTIPPPPSSPIQFPATWWAMPGPGNLVWFADEDFKEIGYVNASIPIPLTINTETSASAFQGEQGSIPVTVSYEGQGSVSLGVSATSFDTRNSQITGQGQDLASAYPVHTSAKFSVAFGASTQTRYMTVTAQDGQVAVSIPVRLTVRSALAVYATIGVAFALTGTAVFLYFRRKRALSEDENVEAGNSSSTNSGS